MLTPEESANIITNLAKKKGVPISKILEECGLNARVINNMKNGSMPSADKILAMANYLNVTSDFLLTGVEIRHDHYQSQKLLSENEETFLSILRQFKSKDDQIEFIGRARKLARDMKLEILSLSEEESRQYI